MTTYTYANLENNVIKVELDGGEVYWVPTDPGNRHYAAILEQSPEIGAYVPTEAELEYMRMKEGQGETNPQAATTASLDAALGISPGPEVEGASPATKKKR